MGTTTIDVPGHGPIDFDDSLTTDQINAQIKALGVQQAATAPAAVKPVPAAPPRSVGDFLTSQLPTSIGKALTGVAHSVANPSETIKSMLSIAGTPLTLPTYAAMSGLEDLGVMPKGTSSRFKEDKLKPALDFGANMSDRWGGLFGGRGDLDFTPGKWAENVGNTLYTDPVGAAMDMSMFTGAGGQLLKSRRAALGSPTVAALNTAGPSLAERILNTTSKVTDPISVITELAKKGIKGAGWLAKEGVRESVGKTSGAGGEALTEAYNVEKAKALDPANLQAIEDQKNLADAMNKTRSPAETVASAKQAVTNMKRRASNGYELDKNGPGGWGTDTTTLDFTSIRNGWDKVYDSLFSGGDRNFPKISPTELTKIDAIGDIINKWEADPTKHTLAGLDDLKQAVNNITRSFEDKQVNRVVRDTTAHIKDVTNAQSDVVYAGQDKNKYRESQSGYETHMKDLKEIEKSLSLTDKASTDTAARKLLSIMRDNVNTNFGQRTATVEKLGEKGDVNLRPEIAGHMLSSKAPRGIAGPIAGGGTLAATMLGLAPFTSWTSLLGIPAGIAAGSPRLMGHAARALGKEAGLYQRYGDQYGIPQTVEAANKLIGHPGMLTGTLSNRTQPGEPGNEIVMPPITVRARGGALRRASR